MSYHIRQSELETNNRIIMDLTKKTLSMYNLEQDIFFGDENIFKSGTIEQKFRMIPNVKVKTQESIPKLIRVDLDENETPEFLWENKIDFHNSFLCNNKINTIPHYWSSYHPDEDFMKSLVHCELRVFHPKNGMPFVNIKIMFKNNSILSEKLTKLHDKCKEFVNNANKSSIGGNTYITLKKDMIEALTTDGILYVANKERKASRNKEDFNTKSYKSPYIDKNIEFIENAIQNPYYYKSEKSINESINFTAFSNQGKNKEYNPEEPIKLASFTDKKKPLFLGINPIMNSIINTEPYFEFDQPIYGSKDPNMVAIYQYYGIPVFNTCRLVNEGIIDGVVRQDFRNNEIPSGWYPDIELTNFLVLKCEYHEEPRKRRN
jgi:hypothetical protein